MCPAVLADALEADHRPSPQMLLDVRGHIERWHVELERLKQLLASVTIEPPTRVQ
jgi:hypothetical protein